MPTTGQVALVNGYDQNSSYFNKTKNNNNCTGQNFTTISKDIVFFTFTLCTFGETADRCVAAKMMCRPPRKYWKKERRHSGTALYYYIFIYDCV